MRGQYTQGAVDGKPVPGYLADLGDDASRASTETFVALKAEVQTWRWANVPFYLRTGKRLPQKVSEIVVQFRGAAVLDLPARAGELSAQPADHPAAARGGDAARDDDQGARAGRPAAAPDRARHQLREGVRHPLPGRLRAAADGHACAATPTLFMRRDEVEAAWTWVEPIIEAWAEPRRPAAPLPGREAGDPTAAIALIERDGRTWHEDAA